jgi:hypothetical protein
MNFYITTPFIPFLGSVSLRSVSFCAKCSPCSLYKAPHPMSTALRQCHCGTHLNVSYCAVMSKRIAIYTMYAVTLVRPNRCALWREVVVTFCPYHMATCHAHCSRKGWQEEGKGPGFP